jgi:hypothetical protein
MVPKAISHSRNERGGISFRVTERDCATPSFLGINRRTQTVRKKKPGRPVTPFGTRKTRPVEAFGTQTTRSGRDEK